MTFIELVRHFELSLQFFIVVFLLVVMGLPLSYIVRIFEKRSTLPDDHYFSGACFVICILCILGFTISAICTCIHALTLL